MFRVPGALHRDPKDSIVDVADILGREVHGRRADVLFQAMQSRRLVRAFSGLPSLLPKPPTASAGLRLAG
jgi:hypothetical protein